MKLSVTFRPALAFAVLLGTLAPARAGERPVKLSGNCHVDVVLGQFTGSGRGTQLGLWTLAGTVEGYLPGLEPGTVDVFGEARYTAVNGDSFYATFEGTIDLVTLVGAGTIFIDGGTGRFANARGQADFVTVHDVVESSFTLTVDGTISTPGP